MKTLCPYCETISAVPIDAPDSDLSARCPHCQRVFVVPKTEVERCPECGGDCAPECGLHPAGCVYGGFSEGYWLKADGCERNHGET